MARLQSSKKSTAQISHPGLASCGTGSCQTCSSEKEGGARFSLMGVVKGRTAEVASGF